MRAPQVRDDAPDFRKALEGTLDLGGNDDALSE
jgi:hypothetical protein